MNYYPVTDRQKAMRKSHHAICTGRLKNNIFYSIDPNIGALVYAPCKSIYNNNGVWPRPGYLELKNMHIWSHP